MSVTDYWDDAARPRSVTVTADGLLDGNPVADDGIGALPVRSKRTLALDTISLQETSSPIAAASNAGGDVTIQSASPPAATEGEVAFISGVNANGTLPEDAYYGWNPDTIPADYSGGYTQSVKWGADTAGTPGGTISYYFNAASGWSSTEQQALSAGLALWSAIANISFVQTTNPFAAQITFTRGHDGKAGTSVTSAVDTSPGHTAGVVGGIYLYQLNAVTISIDTSVAGFGPIAGSFSTAAGYVFDTLVHEEGHAIGLGHAGPYNSTVNPATQQFGPYDSRQWSVMSYIDPNKTNAAYWSQYPVTGTNWGTSSASGEVPTTWMPLDILAAQRLYGVATSTPLAGGQTFGFNSNIAGPAGMFFDFTRNTKPVITIWDEGTGNTLDISGFSTTSAVNLNPGTFSSTCDLTNNIGIAYGTAIDSVICGAANDTIIANGDADTVYGGAGDDTLTVGGGNDIYNGGGGWNQAIFSGARPSYNITYNGDDSVTVSGGGQTNNFRHVEALRFSDQTVAIGTVAPADFSGEGDSDLLWQNANGQAAIWLLNGSTPTTQVAVGPNPGPYWHAVGTGDFDGDGRADILWQNSSGLAAVWLLQGSTVSASASVGADPGPSWHVKATADFDGDGKSDIVWQNDSGQAAIWLMNGASVSDTATVGNNLDPAWHIKGAGDFNGDGKSDILWQNDSGQAAIWLMNGTTQLGGFAVGNNPGLSWDIKGTGDFNGDGKADILWQSDSGQVQIWLMNGASVSSKALVGTSPGSTWHIKGAADVDGDGNADIVWENNSGQAAVWLMDGTTELGSSSLGNNTQNAWQIANYGIAPRKTAGDFNGDGAADLLWQNSSGQAVLWLMSGTNVASSVSPGENPGPAWHVRGSGDFDGNGSSDILWQNDSGQAAVWLMGGTTLLVGSALGTSADPSWHIAGNGDFDGDGKSDILWQNDSGQAAIWRINGTNVSSTALVGTNGGPSWHIKGTGDFDGDGTADMLWQNDNGQVAIWLMQGTSVLSTAIIGNNIDTTWHVKGAGDFNGDGMADILWQNDSGQVAFWTMNVRSVTDAVAVGTNPGTSWRAAGASDLNGDGMSDIVWQNSDGQAAAWLMNGTSVTATANIGTSPGSTWQLFAASA